MGVKTLIKKLVPRPVWDYVRSQKGIFLDSLANFNSEDCARSYEGFTLYYNKGNTIIDRLRSQSHFEPQLQDAIVSHLNEKDHPVLVDVGANIGLISLAVISRIPKVSIYAFEPGPVQSALLAKTIEKNGLQKKIHLERSAAGKESGKLTFHTHVSRDISKDGFMDTGRGEETRSIQVEVITLDSWWKQKSTPHIDAIKIDTEGAELWVLEGATEIVRTLRPMIFFEMEHSNLQAYPYDHLDILRWFEAQKYRIYTLQEEECHFFNVEKVMKSNDTFVARPQ